MTRTVASAAPLRAPGTTQRWLALRGLLLLAFGLLEAFLLLFAFRIPYVTLWSLGFLLAAFMLVDGCAALIEATGPTRSPRGRWARAAYALVGLVGGAAYLATLLLAIAGWGPWVFAIWAVLTGLLEAIEAVPLASEPPTRLLVAALSVLFGVVVLVGPIRDVAVLTLIGAGYAVIAGVLRLSGARRRA
jgi:uncharacterized membrane protein HdeD (DUF308 family)